MHMLVISVLTLPAGARVGLRPDQAATRQPFLAPVPKKKGWFEVLAPIQFKIGEAIQYEGDLPKSMAEEVEAPGVSRGKSAKAASNAGGPSATREVLDQAISDLPGDQTDPEYVVGALRSHFGDLFTTDDEAKVRELVKVPAGSDQP